MPDIKKRVVITQRYIPHYRVPFFEKLHKESSKDFYLEVYFGKLMDKEMILSDLNFPNKQFDLIKIKFFGYSIEAQWKLFFNLIRTPPDLVILEGTFGIITNILLLFIRKLTNRTTIYWTAGWNNPSITDLRYKLKEAVIEFILSLSDGAIVYGTSAKNYLIKRGMKENRIFIAQNTIDIEKIIFNKNEWKIKSEIIIEKLDIKNSKVIAYVGGLTKLKRVNTLIEAIEKLSLKFSDIVCLIIGQGPEKENLIDLCFKKKLSNIIFLGEIIDEIDSYFSVCDISFFQV